MNKFNEEVQKHGPFENYNEDGKLIFRTNYLNGKLNGLWEYYHKNGQICIKGNYINNKQNGLWEHINENGRLLNLYYRII